MFDGRSKVDLIGVAWLKALAEHQVVDNVQRGEFKDASWVEGGAFLGSNVIDEVFEFRLNLQEIKVSDSH